MQSLPCGCLKVWSQYGVFSTVFRTVLEMQCLIDLYNKSYSISATCLCYISLSRTIYCISSLLSHPSMLLPFEVLCCDAVTSFFCLFLTALSASKQVKVPCVHGLWHCDIKGNQEKVQIFIVPFLIPLPVLRKCQFPHSFKSHSYLLFPLPPCKVSDYLPLTRTTATSWVGVQCSGGFEHSWTHACSSFRWLLARFSFTAAHHKIHYNLPRIVWKLSSIQKFHIITNVL